MRRMALSCVPGDARAHSEDVALTRAQSRKRARRAADVEVIGLWWKQPRMRPQIALQRKINCCGILKIYLDISLEIQVQVGNIFSLANSSSSLSSQSFTQPSAYAYFVTQLLRVATFAAFVIRAARRGSG